MSMVREYKLGIMLPESVVENFVRHLLAGECHYWSSVELRVRNFELRVANVESRVSNVELQVRNVKLRVGKVELRVRNVELRVRCFRRA